MGRCNGQAKKIFAGFSDDAGTRFWLLTSGTILSGLYYAALDVGYELYYLSADR